MRFVRFVVALVLLLLVLVAPLQAKPPRHRSHKVSTRKIHRHQKPKVPREIVAKVTFHNASRRKNTTFERPQKPHTVALNRDKHNPLMHKWLISYAYKDKKTGRKIPLRMSVGPIEDVMGGDRTGRYRVDIYVKRMPANYDDINLATLYFKVAN